MLNWKKNTVVDTNIFYIRYGERELAMGIFVEPTLDNYKVQWRVYKDDISPATYAGIQIIERRDILRIRSFTDETALELMKPSIDHGMIAMMYTLAEKVL